MEFIEKMWRVFSEKEFKESEPIKEIMFSQFISYKDTDDFIYGFDMISLYNLMIF